MNLLQDDLSFGEALAIAEQLAPMRGWDFSVEVDEAVGYAKHFDREEWAKEAVEAAQARVLAETRGHP